MYEGPKSNPAKLSVSPGTTIEDLFEQIVWAVILPNPNIRFLLCLDGSRRNIKEFNIWTSIGQTPWLHDHSTFYHIVRTSPSQALEEAAKLGEYTLVDRGTWHGVAASVRDSMTVFVCLLLFEISVTDTAVIMLTRDYIDGRQRRR